MIFAWMLYAVLLVHQGDVPYKPNEHFELKLDYTFRQRPPADRASANMLERQPSSGALLPYVTIQLKVITLQPDETRLRITTNDNNVIRHKKVQPQDEIKFDMGFAADMKDRVKPYEYIVSFLSSDKKDRSRIVISVAEDGTFIVNGEQRGKL